MAKRKSSSKVVLSPEQQAEAKAMDDAMAKAKASGNYWHKHKFSKAEARDSALLCQLPFIKDTRGEAFHADAGLYWWHVTEPIYWHQGVVVGEAFADRVAAILPQNPERIEQALCHSLESMLHQGGSSGIPIGFLRRLAHYACQGMQRGGNHG